MNPPGGEYRRNGVAVAVLTDALSVFLQRPVVDRTALSGVYDVHLLFRPMAAVPAAADAERPDLLTAVEEQLGLRLEAGRGTFPQVVFERIERPQPN